MVTPEISIGYWKAKKIPSWALVSGDISNKFSLQKEILPNIQRTANGYAIKLDANDDAELVGVVQAFLIASKKGNLLDYLERKAATLKFHKDNKNTKFSKETERDTGANGGLGVFNFLKK